MKCAWNLLLCVLPAQIRSEVDRRGAEGVQEIRIRVDRPVELVTQSGNIILDGKVSAECLHYVINAASKYSPWTAATISEGYLTAPGGHRIGICGEAIIQDGTMTGIRKATSLCIRVAKDYPGIANRAPSRGSVLILGPPGSGKTTFLRDMIRIRSKHQHVVVVDERGELFPYEADFHKGVLLDVLSLCRKSQGLEAVLRTMGPDLIAVDEVTSREDCDALLHAGWCGTELLATIHASSSEDLKYREIYRPLIMTGLFQTLIVMKRDKTWHIEHVKC